MARAPALHCPLTCVCRNLCQFPADLIDTVEEDLWCVADADEMATIWRERGCERGRGQVSNRSKQHGVKALPTVVDAGGELDSLEPTEAWQAALDALACTATHTRARRLLPLHRRAQAKLLDAVVVVAHQHTD